MGIPIEPPGKIAGIGCGTCFDVDETPNTIFCTLGNITSDPNFVPPLPGPPIGTYALSYIAGCSWSFNGPFWNISYSGGPGFSTVQVREVQSFKGVEGFGDPCGSWFGLAHFVAPPFIYDHGYALVTMTADCPIISLSALAESVGLDPGADLLAEPAVAPNEFGLVRFARVRDKTNVKILLDCS